MNTDLHNLNVTIDLAHYVAHHADPSAYLFYAECIQEHASMFSAAGEHDTAHAYDLAAAQLRALAP